ncbi:MAG: HAMP domain-containing histidine kinase, partial [Leptospiraceae bacterium]|nr:HAMP domain-containing histidine kinase [Leptospiraceae bacterium]
MIWEAAYGLLLLKIESTVGPLGRILGVFGVLYLSYFCGWQIGLLTFPIFLGFHVWLHSVYDLEWLQGILGPPLATAAAILFGILGNTYRRAREAERRLGDALRTLQEQGSFLARASHELRTPLNAISGHTQLLLRQPDNGFRNSLQQILGASNQLEGLIHNVLEMAQLEKGTVRLEKKAESLPGLIGLVASMAEPEAARKGLGMVVNIDPSLPELLELDRVRLMQVLSNILGNAVRYSDAGTIRIDVSTGESGGPEGSIMVQFSVEDQGTGIRPESLVTIFEPFVQASRRPQQGSGSVGLGLS